MPRGCVRSCGLPRRDTSCELAGLVPGARPVVPMSDGAGGFAPGEGDAPGVWPVTGEPGAVGEVGDVGEAAVPPVLAPPLLLPPVPPELWASAMPPVRASAANVAQTRFMLMLLDASRGQRLMWGWRSIAASSWP